VSEQGWRGRLSGLGRRPARSVWVLVKRARNAASSYCPGEDRWCNHKLSGSKHQLGEREVAEHSVGRIGTAWVSGTSLTSYHYHTDILPTNFEGRTATDDDTPS